MWTRSLAYTHKERSIKLEVSHQANTYQKLTCQPPQVPKTYDWRSLFTMRTQNHQETTSRMYKGKQKPKSKGTGKTLKNPNQSKPKKKFTNSVTKDKGGP